MNTSISIIKKIVVWLSVLLFVTLIFFLVNTTTLRSYTFYLFILTLAQKTIVAILCLFAGYPVLRRFRLRNFPTQLFLTLMATMCAGVVAVTINTYLKIFLFGSYDFSIRRAVVTLLVVFIVTVFTVYIDRLLREKFKLEKEMMVIKGSANILPEANVLSIKNGKSDCAIRYIDLKYISSRGKKTVLHAVDKDYEISRLISEYKNSLPGCFIRIHKQYIINVEFLFGIKYIKGGNYVAHLKDDEDILPVSRTIGPSLKARFGV